VTLLEVRDLDARYGEEQVLHGVSLTIEHGEIVSLGGGEGAGKTTLLRAICGVVRTKGSVLVEGERVVPHTPEHLAHEGVAHIPADRGTFGPLSVLDNLRVGGWVRGGASARDLAHVYELYPELYELRTARAAALEDGQQELLALGRAVMAHPRLLLIDEPSAALHAHLHELNERGTAILAASRVGALTGARRYVLDAGTLRAVA
jgi:branched-chain amino acid transport system ATP-binding protein